MVARVFLRSGAKLTSSLLAGPVLRDGVLTIRRLSRVVCWVAKCCHRLWCRSHMPTVIFFFSAARTVPQVLPCGAANFALVVAGFLQLLNLPAQV